MKHTRIAIAAAAIASLALTAAPASAVTLVKKSDNSAYSGAIVAELDSATATFESSLRDVTCNESEMAGSAVSDGSDADVSSASYTHNGGDCTNSTGGTTQIVANTPWNNGSFTTNSLTIAGVSASAHGSDGLDCNFVGAGSGNSMTLSLQNTQSGLKATATDEQLNRASGSEFLCPSSATLTATYIIRTSAGEDLKVVR